MTSHMHSVSWLPHSLHEDINPYSAHLLKKGDSVCLKHSFYPKVILVKDTRKLLENMFPRLI